jgi:hypothetical protein
MSFVADIVVAVSALFVISFSLWMLKQLFASH